MINQTLRKRAIDIISKMELEADTISERRLIAICWWTLYAMGFTERKTQKESIVHVGKVVEDFLTLDK